MKNEPVEMKSFGSFADENISLANCIYFVGPEQV